MTLTAKKYLGHTIKEKRIDYDGFSFGKGKANALAAITARNCTIVEGALTRGIGAKAYTCNGKYPPIPRGDTENRLFIGKEVDETGQTRERLGYVSPTNNAYLYDEDGEEYVYVATLGKSWAYTAALDKEGRERTVFVSEKGICVLENKTFVYCADIPCENAVCFCGGRVFAATADFWLAYSAPYEPKEYSSDVNDGGKIALRSDFGKIVCLLPLKNKLCVLYERGISMLRTAGTAREFAREDIAYGGGRIYRNGACVSNENGEYAYFVAEDGIYRFDGKGVERICERLSISVSERQPLQGAVAFGHYFVVFLDKNDEWRTVAVCLREGEGCEAFVMRGLTFGGGKCAFYNEDGVFYLDKEGDLPKNEQGVFIARDTDFALPQRKTLRALRLVGKGSCRIRVWTETGEREARVDMQKGVARLPVRLRGNTFGWQITVYRDSEVFALTAEISTLA